MHVTAAVPGVVPVASVAVAWYAFAIVGWVMSVALVMVSDCVVVDSSVLVSGSSSGVSVADQTALAMVWLSGSLMVASSATF